MRNGQSRRIARACCGCVASAPCNRDRRHPAEARSSRSSQTIHLPFARAAFCRRGRHRTHRRFRCRAAGKGSRLRAQCPRCRSRRRDRRSRRSVVCMSSLAWCRAVARHRHRRPREPGLSTGISASLDGSAQLDHFPSLAKAVRNYPRLRPFQHVADDRSGSIYVAPRIDLDPCNKMRRLDSDRFYQRPAGLSHGP